MITKGAVKRMFWNTLLHTALIVGSLLFAAPFVWLLSTSAKAGDELYPPRWRPPVPPRVAASPYMALRDNEYAEKPFQIRVEDWERQSEAIRQKILDHLNALQGQLPSFMAPYLTDPVLAEAIFARLIKRAPDELFKQDIATCAHWFAERATPEVIQEGFDLAYRRMALAEVAFVGWDMRSETPCSAQTIPWKVLEGDVSLVPRPTGLGRSSQEVHYSFAQSGKVILQATLPFTLDPSNFKKIRLATRGDRSWHALWISVEIAGQRYQATEPAYLRTERWQDNVWQVYSEEDTGVMVKTWSTMQADGSSSVQTPGQARITVELRQQSRWGAIWSKYFYNYAEVLRRVPLWRYIRNSVILVVLNIGGQLLGSSLVAFAFARLRWPGRNFCFILLLATLMIPPQVTLIPVFLIWKQLGQYNTLQPLYVPAFFGSAFFIFLLRQFMRSIPTDLEDSAKIDGCGYFGIYRHIALPLVRPALTTIAIFTFMNVWNDFMGPLIFIADQAWYPLSLGLFALHAMLLEFARHEVMMAASVLMTIPVVLLFFLAQRQFIQGITLTGLKG